MRLHGKSSKSRCGEHSVCMEYAPDCLQHSCPAVNMLAISVLLMQTAYSALLYPAVHTGHAACIYGMLVAESLLVESRDSVPGRQTLRHPQS